MFHITLRQIDLIIVPLHVVLQLLMFMHRFRSYYRNFQSGKNRKGIIMSCPVMSLVEIIILENVTRLVQACS